MEIVKVFPGSQVGGPAFVKSIMAPCPWTKIMPTGGVDATWENLKSWFDAGVTCVGMGSKLVRKDLIAAEDWDAIAMATAQCLTWIRQARGHPLYLGVEHIGLAPGSEVLTEGTVRWYSDTFGFKVHESGGSFMLSSAGPGRLEVMKAGAQRAGHIAINVSDFDRAVADLKSRGIGVGEVKAGSAGKSAYLAEPDPAGNAVHLLWRP